MDLIKAPTDNLYKFIALSGMATMVLMFVLIHRHIEFSVSKSVELETAINARYADLQTARLKLEAAQADSPPMTAESAEIAEFKVLGEEATRGLFKSIGEFETAVGQTRAIVDFLPTIIFAYLLVAGFGLVVACGGFWRWYVKLQRPLDHKLAHEVSKLGKPPGRPNKGFWYGYKKE